MHFTKIGINLLIGFIMVITAHSADQPPFTYIYDTNNKTSVADWTRLDEEVTDHQFQGDVVLMNNKLSVVLQQGNTNIELFSQTSEGRVKRAALSPSGNGKPSRLSSVKINENNPSTVSVNVSFKSNSNKKQTLSLELKMGQVFINTKPISNIDNLYIKAKSRFALLPDFFADDIVIDAQQLPVSQAELPSGNFLIQMLGEGESILMSVCNTIEQDIRISLSSDGLNRVINSAEIHYGKNGEIWLAVLDEPGIWHKSDIEKKDTDKIIQLGWDIPFPALWRIDWQRSNRLTDSWEFLEQKPDGTYHKHGWMGNNAAYGQEDWLRVVNRKRWTTVLGLFEYPCWIDKNGDPYIQPLKNRAVQFEGPAIIYPINRIEDTPLDKYTIVDIVRETLGVGPCQYILDLEGQQKSYKGIPTCDARDILNEIYTKKIQKQSEEKIEKTLTDVIAFIKHIRSRIEEYIDFGHEMKAYLKQQKKKHPEMSDFLSEMEDLVEQIDERVERRQDKIKTPEYAESLANKFRNTLIGYEGEDALEKCKEITAGFVQIGGHQDELVGECRMAVKLLRQRAGLAMAVDPTVSGVAQEIRNRTQQILRKPTSYEAPRH